MSTYGTPGTPTYSVTFDTLDSMLASVPDNSNQQIGADDIRNTAFTVWNKIDTLESDINQEIYGITQSIIEIDQEIAGITQSINTINQEIAGITQSIIDINQDFSGITQSIITIIESESSTIRNLYGTHSISDSEYSFASGDSNKSGIGVYRNYKFTGPSGSVYDEGHYYPSSVESNKYIYLDYQSSQSFYGNVGDKIGIFRVEDVFTSDDVLNCTHSIIAIDNILITDSSTYDYTSYTGTGSGFNSPDSDIDDLNFGKTVKRIQVDFVDIINGSSFRKYTFIRSNDKFGSVAYGTNNFAGGVSSFSEGENNISVGDYSHSEGLFNSSIGLNSHSEGIYTISDGNSSHSEGRKTTSIGDNSHAEGRSTISRGDDSHSEGSNTISKGISSHAEGYNSISTGDASHAEGNQTNSKGRYSHAEGNSSISKGESSHAEGQQTYAYGINSHSEGYETKSGIQCYKIDEIVTNIDSVDIYLKDYYTTSVQLNLNSLIYFTGTSSFQPRQTLDLDSTSMFYEINITDVDLDNRVRINIDIPYNYIGSKIASEQFLYIMNSKSKNGHSEGESTISSAPNSHAEGKLTISSGNNSHAEGTLTESAGEYSHAEGFGSLASGEASHAEGTDTESVGNSSHAGGIQSKSTHPGEFANASGMISTKGDAQTMILDFSYSGSGSELGSFITMSCGGSNLYIPETNALLNINCQLSILGDDGDWRIETKGMFIYKLDTTISAYDMSGTLANNSGNGLLMDCYSDFGEVIGSDYISIGIRGLTAYNSTIRAHSTLTISKIAFL